MESTKVILVEPQESLNIGAVARAMSNFGFKQLRLVAPKDYSVEQAKRTGRHAEAILENIQISESFEDAIREEQEVIGFTARSGKNRLSTSALPSWIKEVSPDCKRALVFGPERTGLRQEHLEQCTQLVTIPTASENSSLNLAQAVTLVLYQLHITEHSTEEMVDGLAPMERYQHLEKLIIQAAEQSEFIGTASPDTMPGILKSLTRKSQYTEREIQILLGLFDRIVKNLAFRP